MSQPYLKIAILVAATIVSAIPVWTTPVSTSPPQQTKLHYVGNGTWVHNNTFNVTRYDRITMEPVYNNNLSSTTFFVAISERNFRTVNTPLGASVFWILKSALNPPKHQPCIANVPEPGDPRGPCVNSTVSLFFNDNLEPFLMTKNLLEFEVLPDNYITGWTFERSKTVATKGNPVGVVLSPPRTSPDVNNTIRDDGTPKQHLSIIDEHTTFVLDLQNFTKTLTYISPFAAVWPITAFHAGITVMGCDTTQAIAYLGNGFMGLQISSVNNPPLEMIVAPNDVRARIVNRLPPRRRLEPPGPYAGPIYKVYVLSDGNFYLGHGMSKISREVAAYPEESLDYRYHLSLANLDTLAMLAELSSGKSKDVSYYLYRIIARLAVATFSLAEVIRLSDYMLLQEAIDVDINLRLIVPLVMKYAAGGTADSSYTSSDVAMDQFEVAQAQIEKIVADINIENELRKPMYEHRSLLKSVYAYSRKPLPNAVSFANRLITAMYKEAIKDRITWNSTMREVLFFAVGAAAGSHVILTDGPDLGLHAHKDSLMFLSLNRNILLLCTAMCTASHAVSAGVKLEEVMAGLIAGGVQFSLLEVFSPCMASARFDLAEEEHVLDLLSVIPPRLYTDLNTGLEDDGTTIHSYGRSANGILNSRIAYNFDAVRVFTPELASCSTKLPKVLVVLPLASNRSYVITRTAPNIGLTYSLDGVNIAKPIVISYITYGNCQVSRATIRSVYLDHPGHTQSCVYCGSVFMRYMASGAIMDLIYIDDKDVELQLVAGENSTIPAFNPKLYTPSMNALLMFPNGTVTLMSAFASYSAFKIPSTYLWASIGGLLLAILILYVIVKMLCGGVINNDYSLLLNSE
ncbi:envelope glycoprotein H [Equid alphaherpesvirus 4]|nr:envelope glycoprotein H [Equid alphaherpesvirus 4]QYL35310.1 envelope glycoprotein H [Equid alphaherpesvirus 4]QYL35387.1 envelope glycoprotein H [Equid alphaherpesvirus 4]QYL35465.1 envelope glycoprotein H [Equid alphaherpesvirus 4]